VLISLAREYRRVVSYNEVPPVLRHAIISAEDKHFFTHAGVDYRALPREDPVRGSARVGSLTRIPRLSW
jgi:membrane peptidoglycan carboxypeptidase